MQPLRRAPPPSLCDARPRLIKRREPPLCPGSLGLQANPALMLQRSSRGPLLTTPPAHWQPHSGGAHSSPSPRQPISPHPLAQRSAATNRLAPNVARARLLGDPASAGSRNLTRRRMCGSHTACEPAARSLPPSSPPPSRRRALVPLALCGQHRQAARRARVCCPSRVTLQCHDAAAAMPPPLHAAASSGVPLGDRRLPTHAMWAGRQLHTSPHCSPSWRLCVRRAHAPLLLRAAAARCAAVRGAGSRCCKRCKPLQRVQPVIVINSHCSATATRGAAPYTGPVRDLCTTSRHHGAAAGSARPSGKILASQDCIARTAWRR